MLGGNDGFDLDIIKPNNVGIQQNLESNNQMATNNQDLLDLLGLDQIETTPTMPTIQQQATSTSNNEIGLILENNNTNILTNVINNQNILSGDLFSTNNIVNGEFLIIFL